VQAGVPDHFGVRLLCPAHAKYAHAESQGADSRDSLADGPHTYDYYRLALQFLATVRERSCAVPGGLANLRIDAGQLAREGDHLADRVFRDARGVHRGHVGNGHPVPAGLIHGNHVQAGTMPDDTPQPRGPAEQIRGQRRTHDDEAGINRFLLEGRGSWPGEPASAARAARTPDRRWGW